MTNYYVRSPLDPKPENRGWFKVPREQYKLIARTFNRRGAGRVQVGTRYEGAIAIKRMTIFVSNA